MSHTSFYALRIASLAALPLVAVLAPQAAFATGVSAGTLIQNTARATYTTGTASGSVDSNTVTIKVDELLDVAVSSLDSGPISGSTAPVTLRFTVTNTGNGPESYLITADPAVAGNDFNMVIQTIAIDTNGDGDYDVGVDQVIANGAATPLIAADTGTTIFVIATLPSGAADGDTSQVRLTADAQTGTGAPGTVFAGQGENGGDAVVGTSGASEFAQGNIVASLATVTLTKSAVVADPFGGTETVPGAIVTYSIVASVTGTGAVSNLRVTDVIPTGTSYQAGTLRLDTTTLSDPADADAGSASASGVDVNLGTVSGGASQTVSFKVKID